MRLDDLIRRESEPPSLRDGRKDQNAFHPRKALSDTDARTSVERKVSEFRTVLLGFRGEALGIKTLGTG